MTESTLRD